MAKSKKKKGKLPGFAKQWENISRVRTRFRKQQGWLKWDHGDNGEKVIRSTQSLKYNAETLSAIFLVHGLRKFNVTTLRNEVKELFQTVGYVPEKPDEVDDDGGDLKKLYYFALRRCQDDKTVQELFRIIRRLKRGVALPELNQGEDSEAEDDEDNEGEEEEEEEEKEEDEELEADGEGHENGEEEKESFTDDKEVDPDPPLRQSLKRPAAAKAAPADKTRTKPLIAMPPPPKPNPKRKVKETEPEFEFPEIKPNPLASGSGRSEARVELDWASAEIQRLEAELGVLPG
ncbi:unnamed protein product [Symbiodinium sp. CCMP2592]|nr:unnamed protein product [Symbiodinium sp. CCMP2592]